MLVRVARGVSEVINRKAHPYHIHAHSANRVGRPPQLARQISFAHHDIRRGKFTVVDCYRWSLDTLIGVEIHVDLLSVFRQKRIL